MTPSPHAAVSSDGRYKPGDLIHEKYQLVRRLGQGGMGTVWVAQNTVLQVSVAIKLIALNGETDSDETAERLLREARAAARLDHPAIVRVFDFGRTAHGDPFIVMELLHGESLADILARDARMTAVESVRSMLPIAEALASAHDKGVVHRDVKPENVILSSTEDGKTQPKLLDFGIASLQEKSTRITQEKRLTREGSVVGTPAYMSPEQAMGKADLDQRTDIWSFGVMLYELMTGRLPFDADNYNALLYEIIHRSPEPVMAHAAGDDELWQILEVALRKRPEERWGSMRAFGEALALWLVDHGIHDDICAASLRSSWLDSTPAPVGKIDRGDSGRGGSPRSTRKATPPLVVPLPSKPPQSQPRVRPHTHRVNWPLRIGFLAACFAAGVLLVSELVASDPSPDSGAPQTTQTQASPADLARQSTSTPLKPGRSDSHSKPEVETLQVDDIPGEAEDAPRSAEKKTQTAAPKKKSRTQSTRRKRKANGQIDFGF